MAADALGTLDAILAGLHTLAADSESVQDEQVRQRLTGAIAGLRAAVSTARGQVLQLQEKHDRLAAKSRETTAPAPGSKPPAARVKFGCYQFDGIEGLFCPSCYDQRNRRIRTTPFNSESLVCPNCRTLFPMR
jgi:hypothetical protein